MAEALDWIDEFPPSGGGLNRLRASTGPNSALDCDGFNLGRKRILNTQLVAVLYAGGVCLLLTSNPADFGFLAYWIL